MLTGIGLVGQEMIFVFLVILAPLFPLWTILKKSGQNPWFSLLALLPGIGVLLVLYLAAFSTWNVRGK
ncbi:hypothetical protein [Fibrella arboris]|uniref:hypothetical protein n=1 Tax=Fibrella arboris TaxID=3242486 RepID=UPI003520ACFA